MILLTNRNDLVEADCMLDDAYPACHACSASDHLHLRIATHSHAVENVARRPKIVLQELEVLNVVSSVNLRQHVLR